jgi:NAD(P)-dependent dehydrogenase (short-subunit alcohol dehydrogenase family)
MQIDLAGRTARVGGAGGAVGDAIARALAANGAILATLAAESCDILVLDVRFGSDPAQVVTIAREAGQHMAARGWGRIVLVVAVLGVVPVRDELAASVAAAGLVQATRALAMELSGRGVLVNAVAVMPLADEPLAKRLLSHVPLGHLSSVQDVVNAMLFLVDPDNSYTTGHVLTVDCGWTAGYSRDF